MNTQAIEAFALYIAVEWLVTVIITVTDKIKAKNGRWRISEKCLILLGLLGGAIPELVTMLIIRHKTKHIKFMAGLPFIIVLHALLAVLLIYYKILPVI